ncbi:MAG: 16S rRNA (cytosine(1402)-N(4))-methyltransferase RsmH [Candidatus Melainabacteria bacterium]|nr:16S rRNA (cytosine(1402)-N(4))-methyltransferase RsmH [Candidatus Melainabacteria bacterium]
MEHIPVLLNEVIDALDVRPGLTYVDATAGAGGHLARIAELTEGKSKLYAFDRDAGSLERLKERFGDKVTMIHSNFRYLKASLSQCGANTIDGGILADLGVSSMQIDQGERGFSFQKEGPLDMRMDRSESVSAYSIVNQWPEGALADIIYKYGEERHSRKIANRIVANRPIESTLALADIVARCIPRAADKKNYKKSFGSAGGGYIHPATRTFQAIRMAVNEELESLEEFLRESLTILKPGARLVVITFHSLEDRIVKQFFKMAAASCICPPRAPICTCKKECEVLIITRKPVTASEDELLANTRSRSAKLRAAQKLI